MRQLTDEEKEMIVDSQDWDEDKRLYAIDDILMTPFQRAWLTKNGLSVHDLLNGRYQIEDEESIHAIFFTQWNTILKGNGLDRQFSEAPIGKAMLDSISENMGGIEFDFSAEDNPE
jgi:hypothetical protein